MDKPNLLLTGSSGLIGSILAEGLADSFEIHGVDRVPSQQPRRITADISGYAETEKALRQIPALEHLVHLAGDRRVSAGWDSVLNNNLIATRNVFEAARQVGVRRVVYASSNHVTGMYEGSPGDQHLHEQHEPEPITERHPIRPDSLYGVSKAFGEVLARYYCARYGLEAVCLRIGSVIRDDDPGEDLRLRKVWLSYRDLVQLVRKSLLAELVFGIYYGVSANKGRFWDIFNAREDLGYVPLDGAR